jgi:hypothetical protein
MIVEIHPRYSLADFRADEFRLFEGGLVGS